MNEKIKIVPPTVEELQAENARINSEYLKVSSELSALKLSLREKAVATRESTAEQRHDDLFRLIRLLLDVQR